jgi:hypothetical protein
MAHSHVKKSTVETDYEAELAQMQDGVRRLHEHKLQVGSAPCVARIEEGSEIELRLCTECVCAFRTSVCACNQAASRYR